MPLDYDESALKNAQLLSSKNDEIRKKVAKSLKKIKDGFFKGEKVVLDSGLTKKEVEEISGAQEKSKKCLAQWTQIQKSFQVNLKKAFQARKVEIAQELKNLESEMKSIEKEFGDFRPILGSGPESDLNKALKQMK